MKWISIFLFLIFSSQAVAQTLTEKTANKKFESRDYAYAIPLFERLLKKHPDNINYKFRLAECYRKVKSYNKALELYTELANSKKATSAILWYYAQVLASNGKYQEASNTLDRYLEIIGTNEDAISLQKNYQTIDRFLADSLQYEIYYLHAINSWQGDFSPAIYNNGLVFCSSRTHGGAIRTVEGYDGTSLVDLYVVKDTADIMHDLRSSVSDPRYKVIKKRHFNDDYTPVTSNDTNIPGTYLHNFSHDSVKHVGGHHVPVHRISDKYSGHHLGPVCFYENGKKIIFTANEENTTDGTFHLALFSADFDGKRIKNIKKLPFNNSRYSIGHPVFSPDFSRLYFSSDMPGGSGGADIYYVSYHNGYWGIPQNLTTVNTKGNELFPSMDQKGNLYFSSDLHPGLGGLDIFRATMLGEKVVSIENMGYPINSSADDFGITHEPGGRGGYFSSNRKRGLSDDDIYYFVKKCNSFNFKVIDLQTKMALANVSLTFSNLELKTNEKGIATACLDEVSTVTASLHGYETQSVLPDSSYVEIKMEPLSFEVTGILGQDNRKNPIPNASVSLYDTENQILLSQIETDSTGHFKFALEHNRQYEIEATKEKCASHSVMVSTRELTTSQKFEEDIILFCEGDVIEIENIYYDYNKATIRADASSALDSLVLLLNEYPDMRIELRSHTDARGDHTFNMKLSAKRAQSVVDYLIGHGIVPFRLRAVGLGETQPVVDCASKTCSEEEHQQNRRTEFKIISIDRGL